MSNLSTQYYRSLATFLEKDLKSRDPVRRAGAVARLRRVREPFRDMAEASVVGSFRFADALDAVAIEQGFPSWLDLQGQVGATGVITAADDDIPDDGRLKRIQVNLGNSTDGPVGAVIWVYAYTADEALEIARAAIPLESGLIDPAARDKEVDYLQVYFNPDALGPADIELWEYADEDDDDDAGDEDEWEDDDDEYRGTSYYVPARYVAKVSDENGVASYETVMGHRGDFRGHPSQAVLIAKREWGEHLVAVWSEDGAGEPVDPLYDRDAEDDSAVYRAADGADEGMSDEG